MSKVIVLITATNNVIKGRSTFGFGSTYMIDTDMARDLIAEGSAEFFEAPDQDSLTEEERCELQKSFVR